MNYENSDKMTSANLFAVFIAILIAIVGFGFLRDFIVFVLSKMYEFFIQHK